MQNQRTSVLNIIQYEWRNAQTRDDLLKLVELATPLIKRKEYAWLGAELVKRIEWVNEQLKMV